MSCKTCKYFAVPLADVERETRHCPGANPLGDPAKKTCVLDDKEGFVVDPTGTARCPQYVPVFLRFR